MSDQSFLDVVNLKTHFNTERGQITAVDGVSFHVKKGEILGLVGESGCGKSVTSQSIMRLFDEKHTAKHEGKINFNGQDLLKLSEEKMQSIRGNEIAMIFQDPLSSLNPVCTIGAQISEAIFLHQNISRREACKTSIEMLRLVGIPAPGKRINKHT